MGSAIITPPASAPRHSRITRAGKCVRPATEHDAAGIAALERAPAQAPFVIAWPHERHRRAIASPDFAYFIADAAPGGPDPAIPRGYAILGGLQNAHRSIEIIRIVVDGKRFGLGADLLDAVVRFAFHERGAHRIWSDTFDDNLAVRRMARHYGFTEEGMLRDAIVYDGRYRSVVFMGLLEDEAMPIIGAPISTVVNSTSGVTAPHFLHPNSVAP